PAATAILAARFHLARVHAADRGAFLDSTPADDDPSSRTGPTGSLAHGTLRMICCPRPSGRGRVLVATQLGRGAAASARGRAPWARRCGARAGVHRGGRGRSREPPPGPAGSGATDPTS